MQPAFGVTANGSCHSSSQRRSDVARSGLDAEPADRGGVRQSPARSRPLAPELSSAAWARTLVVLNREDAQQWLHGFAGGECGVGRATAMSDARPAPVRSHRLYIECVIVSTKRHIGGRCRAAAEVDASPRRIPVPMCAVIASSTLRLNQDPHWQSAAAGRRPGPSVAMTTPGCQLSP